MRPAPQDQETGLVIIPFLYLLFHCASKLQASKQLFQEEVDTATAPLPVTF